MRIDSASLAVLGDSREERGQGRAPLWLVEARASAYAYASASASASADAYADADADASASADADASAYAYASADASADADASAYADHPIQKQLINSIKNSEDEMTQGLAILFSTGTYFSSCRIGWLRQVTGDEWEIDSARNVRRTASNGIMALAQCKAAKGLGGHEMGEVDTEPESVHRLHMLKAIRVPRADWPKWVKEFPALRERLEAAP